MVRSLYSGIAGLKTQQVRMDVIGNNIANVGTYGYKSGRATFKDVYYQTQSTASAATTAAGGTNPIQIGYGNTVGSVDINTATSAMSSTGYSLDVAVTGEGFLQVMDPEGNLFYTKAGMLDIDSNGSLVDINGNFVLGSSGTLAEPSSNVIQITLPYLDPSASKAEDTINEIGYTMTSTNSTDKANVSFKFVSSSSLPIGQQMTAEVTSNSIVVTLNANETFTTLDDFNQVMNEAITAANGGVEHVAGAFTLGMEDPSAFVSGITGAEIVSGDFGYNAGSVTIPSDLKSMFSLESVNDGFTGNSTTTNMVVTLDASNNLTVTMGDYTGTVNASQMSSAGTLLMKNTVTPAGATAPDRTDSFVISYPSLTTLRANILPTGTNTYTSANPAVMEPSEPTKSLGLGVNGFKLTGGTEGGEQTVANLTSISINDDGVIVGTHDVYGIVELGRIDLATFANPAGLSQVGNTYFETTLNSGDAILAHPGTDGTGSLVSATLEASNVDLSNEFSDMIMTQRGFQASSRVITVTDTMLEELINLKR